MMGEADPQRTLFHAISLETFVRAGHPLRRIGSLIDNRGIRHAFHGLCAPTARPSIDMTMAGSANRAATPQTSKQRKSRVSP